MVCRALLALALLVCCANQLLAEVTQEEHSALYQASSTGSHHLVSREQYAQHEAIKAAISKGSRKLLPTTLRTRRNRQLQQFFFGLPIFGALGTTTSRACARAAVAGAAQTTAENADNSMRQQAPEQTAEQAPTQTTVIPPPVRQDNPQPFQAAGTSQEAAASAQAMNFDSWFTARLCGYPKTADNFNLDRLGRPWGYDAATKQSCTFKEPEAPPLISWDGAPDCQYALIDNNALPDQQGQLWGYDGVTGVSCAFKSQTLPAAHYEQAPATSQAPAQYCIPFDAQTRTFSVLTAGDSITQGSIPSRGFNYPYAIPLEQQLRRVMGPNTRCIDAGLGGGGIFQYGFSISQRFPEYYRDQLKRRKYDLVVIMIGINDLLRGGSPADDIMAGLQPLFDETLAQGIPIISIPPTAAPGFVAETDPKESERKKLADLLKAAAAKRAQDTNGQGPQLWVLDLQSGQMDFYKMSPEQRAQWLDDGLHLTQYAYEQLGTFVYDEVMRHMCQIPSISAKDAAHVVAQETSYTIFPDAAAARP